MRTETIGSILHLKNNSMYKKYWMRNYIKRKSRLILFKKKIYFNETEHVQFYSVGEHQEH